MEQFSGRRPINLALIFSRNRKAERTSSRGHVCPLILLAALLALGMGSLGFAQEPTVCIIINGLGGMPEYEENFIQWKDQLADIFRERLQAQVYTLDGRTQKREEIIQVIRKATASLSPEHQFWMFLIGHGNFDGTNYRFQIKGPDLTSSDLKGIFDTVGSHKNFLVAATEASGDLLGALGSERRVIVTATRNSQERQPPLFLSFFLEAANSAEADTDKNGKVSLLEAFLFSRQKTAEWFESKGRLQTEHAALNDSSRVQLGSERKESEASPTGSEGMLAAVAYISIPAQKAYSSAEARQLEQEKSAIERDIDDLKFRKGELSEAEYYQKLEDLLLKLASINEKIERLEGTP